MNLIYAILLTFAIMGSVAFIGMRSLIIERREKQEAKAAKAQAIKLTVSEVKP